jgi:hypothetical protein
MVDKIFINFFLYLLIAIVSIAFIIIILSFLKDIFFRLDVKSSIGKIYSHLGDIIMIIKENDSEIPLILYCKDNGLDIEDVYKTLKVSNFIEAKALLSNTFIGEFLRWSKRTNNIIDISNEFRKILNKKISNKDLEELVLIEHIYFDMINKINENNESNESNESNGQKEFGGQNDYK